MLLTEYDEQETLELFRLDTERAKTRAAEEGRKEGWEKGLEEDVFLQKLAEKTGK